jgi:glycosyltransferase involved in cell wall biosynthesis
MPTVSVIIPTFNCAPYIRETIDSVLNQTAPGVELIVVDDGSTDGTVDLIRGYGDRLQLFVQANARVCAARNKGIAAATGQFICLLDHDDYWFPDKLETEMKHFEAQPALGVVTSVAIRWHPNADGSYPLPASIDRSQYPDEVAEETSGWVYHHLLYDAFMLTSASIFRREVFDKCGVFDVNLPYSEDWDMWLRLSREFQFRMLRRPTTLYRQHKNQGSRTVRNIDYRTRLLTSAVAKWGVQSRDGQSIDPGRLARQLAKYHAEFALGHLQGGNRRIALASFMKAWRQHPTNLRYLAYAVAGMAGWAPKH